MKAKEKTQLAVTSALIAAAYAALTYLSNIFGLAYGPIQLRISEALTVLPALTPAAIPGLTIGCFIANIGSFNAADMVFGTLATLAAALLSYFFRSIKLKGIPFLSIAAPVAVNSVVIGFEIALFFLPEGFSLWGFLLSGTEVGLGELAVCFGLGIPFYLTSERLRIFNGKFSG